MNNLIAPQVSVARRVWLSRIAGGVLGVLICLLFISGQEQNALGQLVALTLEKAQVQTNLNRAVTLSQEKDSANAKSETRENLAPNESVLEIRQRLEFIASRQSERQSLSEVQSYLMQGRAHHVNAKVQLQVLEWQEGKMLWEGQVTSPQDLVPLHQHLLTFSNWQEAPMWPPFQWMAPNAQALPRDLSLYSFRMQAHLQSSFKGAAATQKPQEKHHE